jgi:hypothetical protein
VVGISLRDGGANQTRHFPGICAPASHGSSAFAGCRGGLPNPFDNEGKEVNLMTKESESNNSQKQNEYPTHQMRLPGFITDEEIGLGDVVKRVTSYLLKSDGW